MGFLRAALILGIVTPLLLVGGSACGSDGDTDAGRVRVVTTLGIFADFTRNVGGDRVGVIALLPPGADAHTFELEPRQLSGVTKADIVFVNGLDFEGALLSPLEENLPSGTPMVELSQGLAPLNGNPHFWLDVTYAMHYVEQIRDGLSAIDPEGATLYTANAESYLSALGALDAEIQAGIAIIPPQRRKLVTFHDAFPYLARRYGLDVVAFVLEAPGREPSAAIVAALTRKIQEERVPTVYAEPQFNARILELAAGDAGVHIRELYSDSLSGDIDTYVKMMRYNLKQLQEGLGGA